MSKKRKLPPLDLLRDRLDYDSISGVFVWKDSGRIAGSVASDKYVKISIDGLAYGAHRLAWLMIVGEEPDEMDHINGVRTDNRFCNLRCVTKQQNAWNRTVRSDSKTGIKGVTYVPRDGRWWAKIVIKGKTMSLGVFSTPEDAGEAYKGAAELLYGDYAVHISRKS